MTQFIRNAWYVAAWSKEVGRHLLPRRILDERVVLYRKNDGTPAALLDRCAHKLAPLSMGRLVDDVVQCGYHGMEYDGTGTCVRVPGQDRIPRNSSVRSFPLIERYNAIWIWTGDASLADASKMIDIEHYGEPGWHVLDGGYQHHEAAYLNIADNLMDPAHTTFVHGRTIAMARAAEVPVEVEESDIHVCAHRWTNDTDPIPSDRKIAQFSGRVDRRQSYNYFPPGISRVDAVTIPTGQPHTDEVIAKGLRTAGYKFLTPETEDRTHFFWMQLRNFDVPDYKMEEFIRAQHDTFQEDNVVLSAIQREQAATGVVQQAYLAIDEAPTKMRRMIQRMLDAERAQARP
jgi:phenylpropionate dioxygenase-like ring-hydroxylating dioxygenase large terminal subunit